MRFQTLDPGLRRGDDPYLNRIAFSLCFFSSGPGMGLPQRHLTFLERLFDTLECMTYEFGTFPSGDPGTKSAPL